VTQGTEQTPTRAKSIALPRQIAIYLIRKHIGISFKEIGTYFGGKNHTTIMHAFRKVEAGIEKNDRIREEVSAIQSSL